MVAVGTTVTRALESSVQRGLAAPSSGWTERVVTADDPRSSSAGSSPGGTTRTRHTCCWSKPWPGAELTQAAYDAAVRAHYLWHEFGDSALLLP